MFKIPGRKKSAIISTSPFLEAERLFLEAFGGYEAVSARNDIQARLHASPEIVIAGFKQSARASCIETIRSGKAADFQKRANAALGRESQPSDITMHTDSSEIDACSQARAKEEYAAQRQMDLRNQTNVSVVVTGLTLIGVFSSLGLMVGERRRYADLKTGNANPSLKI